MVSLEQLSRYAALLLTVPDFVPRSENCAQVFAESLLNAGVHYADRIFFLQQVGTNIYDPYAFYRPSPFILSPS